MPTYTYLCSICNRSFELLVSMSHDIRELPCPQCGAKKLEKVFSGFRIGRSNISEASSKCGSCSGGDCSSCS
ncbi:MAG: zinc ribbon domain-containing protein [Candidatus Omnitrophota bacterium]|nr:zinc ribbon domain-containing protein [Candidatus Omnitrophota bacterium]